VFFTCSIWTPLQVFFTCSIQSEDVTVITFALLPYSVLRYPRAAFVLQAEFCTLSAPNSEALITRPPITAIYSTSK
jgi:hypothetical protein